MTAVRRIGKQRDLMGGSPIWSVAEQALYWVDIRRPALRRVDETTGVVETRDMPAMVGAVALTATPRRLVVALAERIALYDWRTGALETLAELPGPFPGHRFNKGRCDREGRFWVGAMHDVTRAPEGTLFRLGPAGLTPVLDGVSVPNSLAWSPDGRVMYFADSARHAIHRHDYDPESGTPGPASLLARMDPPGLPGGSAVDAEGFLWNAEPYAARVMRYGPRGAVDREILLPVDRPTACAFGGPYLKRLYITTASQDMDDRALAAEPLAGALLTIDAGVRGLPEPVCAALPRLPMPGAQP